jgi:site-specific DNA-methyltransferase (adenine-specific)
VVAGLLPNVTNPINIKFDNQIIIQNDCLKELKNMPNEIIDIFITSPPYNIGLKYNTYQDHKDENEYLEWLYEIFTQIKRVLRKDGSVFLNIGSTNINPWLSFDVANLLRELLVLQNRIVWVKSISIGERTFGHFKPINSGRFTNNTFEDIFHFTKNGDVKINRTAIGVKYMDKNNLKRNKNHNDLRCRGNTWFIPYETICTKSQKGNHPGIFPEKLVEWCIRLADYDQNTIVCDPFLGSGTTLVVTKKLGVKGIGIEIDKAYVEYAYRRL